MSARDYNPAAPWTVQGPSDAPWVQDANGNTMPLCMDDARLIAQAPAMAEALRAITLQYYGNSPGGGCPLVNGVRATTTGLRDEIERARAILSTIEGNRP